jgi:D-alanine-D-alanine ligase
MERPRSADIFAAHEEESVMTRRIGVVFGGRSAEHKVSVVSARTVARGLRLAGYEAVALGIAEDGCWVEVAQGERALAGEVDQLPALGRPIVSTLGVLVDAGVDGIFPIVHGTWGEDGTLQGLCEMLDLPYVGPNVLASAVFFDKATTKRVVQAAGVPVVDWEVVSRGELRADPLAVLARAARLGLPAFVKPSAGGSSVGVAKVKAAEELLPALEQALAFDDVALVERSVEGRELECAVLGYRTIEASGIGEIVPGREFYDYADKYLEDGAQLILQAELDPAVSDAIREAAVRAFAAVGGCGLSRVDFLMDRSGFYLNEINTLPGFTAISMYPKLWELAGVPLGDLVGRLVAIAFERHADRARLDASIKGFIASLAKS